MSQIHESSQCIMLHTQQIHAVSTSDIAQANHCINTHRQDYVCTVQSKHWLLLHMLR
jgi:hypothetical protein